MAKNILYLSYDGMTDPLGQSQVLPYLIGLGKKGYNISLISFEKPEAYAENQILIRIICENAGLHWHPLRYTKQPPLLSTLFDIRRMKRMAAKIHKGQSIDLVHCRSYIAAIAGSWIKKNFNIPYIFDMRGFWPDERVDGNLWNLKNPLYRKVYQYFKKKEQEFLEDADHTICLTQAALNEIHSWNHIRNNPVPGTVIPCCVDMDHFDPTRIDAATQAILRRQLGIGSGNKILTYVGSIGTWYMPEEMLDFYKAALEVDPGLVFLFITRDDPALILRLAAQKNISTDKIFIKAGSRSEMPLLISLSDYSIFFILPAYSKMASSPTKQAEIMRLGIPLICNDRIGDTSYVLNKYKAGIVISEFNTVSYRDAVRKITTTVFNAERIRQGALDFYNLETGIERYHRVYSDLLSN